MPKEKQKKGFTLIEIMIVVAIIILLTSFVVIAVNISRNRTRDAIIISSLEQIQALAETVYNPGDGYKPLYNMRASIRAPITIPEDHRSIAEIKNKIKDIGMNRREINIYFPEDSISPSVSGYNTYCAYVFLVYNPDEIFCVDSTGFANKINVKNKEVNCQKPDNLYSDCRFTD
jgi:prepilin-type N-terminal cleavage/methylation domain-containing protein